jgi:hypothetical protein
MISERRRPCILSLVCADDRKEIITFQELTGSLIPVNEVSICCGLFIKAGARKEIRAFPHVVMHKTLIHFFLPEILDGIRPQNVKPCVGGSRNRSIWGDP